MPSPMKGSPHQMMMIMRPCWAPQGSTSCRVLDRFLCAETTGTRRHLHSLVTSRGFCGRHHRQKHATIPSLSASRQGILQNGTILSTPPTLTKRSHIALLSHRSFSTKNNNNNPLGLDDFDPDDVDPARVKSASSNNHQPPSNNNSTTTLLFQRRTGSLQLARSGFVGGSLFSAFWLWYALDFVPAVNNSGIPDLHVHEAVPVIGLIFGAACQTIVTLYPLCLMDKMEYRVTKANNNNTTTSQHELLVYPYTLPRVVPATQPVCFDLGTLTMDAASPEANALGVQKLADYQGFVRLYERPPATPEGEPAQKASASFPKLSLDLPYVMDIRGNDDVPDSDLLLKAIFHPQLLMSSTLASSRKATKNLSSPSRKRAKKGGQRQRRR